jgi:hypothetical protein
MRLRPDILLVSPSWWNRLVDKWFAGRLREVRVIEPAPWRFPFSCDLRWDGESESWSVGIVPGWCESPTGDPSPTVETLARLCPRAAQRLDEDDPEAMVTARLDESPRLLIPQSLWRAEGTDAAVGGGQGAVGRGRLPDEIVRRGVLPPVTVRETESGLVQQVSGLATARADAALARAVEIYLEHGREVISLGAIAAAGAEVDFQVSFLPASPASSRIGLRRAWPEEESVERWLLSGAAAVADEGIDRTRIATLWLTSPRGEPEGSEPDQRWRPYVEQRLSRNLAYEVTGPDIRAVPPLRLSFLGRTLAFGAGAGIINSLAGDIQNRADELDARLAWTRTTGEFVRI